MYRHNEHEEHHREPRGKFEHALEEEAETVDHILTEASKKSCRHCPHGQRY